MIMWWSFETVAVVTGGNKGIGLETVKQLASKGLTVVLTARDEKLGRDAMDSLHALGLTNVVFHALDIASPESVTEFAKWIKSTYGGLDILVTKSQFPVSELEVYGINLLQILITSALKIEIVPLELLKIMMHIKQILNLGGHVNNAGVVHLGPFEEKLAINTVEVNYIGTKNMTEAMLPLLKLSDAGARIVFISSLVAQFINLRKPDYREQLNDPDKLTQSTLDKLYQDYLVAVEAGEEEAEKFGFSYCISKILLNAYTRLLAKRGADRQEGQKIFVNCVHPGRVNTDFNTKVGGISIEEGADTGVWLALLPKDASPSGLFFSQRKAVSYDGDVAWNVDSYRALPNKIQ